MAGFPAGPINFDNRAISPFGLDRDPADWLPSAASIERLAAIRQHVVDCRALLADSETMRELHAAKYAHEQRVEYLLKPRGHGGGNLDEGDPLVIAERKRVDKATADLRRAKQLDAVRDAAWRTAGGVASNVENFLKTLPADHELQPVDDIDAATILKRSEVLTDGIERLQRRVREWKADLHRVRSAPIPSAVAREIAGGQIDALAAAGEPYTSGCVEHAEKIVWPTRLLNAVVKNAETLPGAVAQIEITDALGLIAWLFKAELKAKVCACIDADADDSAALTQDERKAQEQTILSDMLAVERQEVALIFKAQRDGLSIEFRPDTSPTALLGVALVKVGPRDLPSGSSPEHAGHIGRR